MLEFRDTTQDSFEYWGIGFNYTYNDAKKALSVFHKDTERFLSRFELDKIQSTHARDYTKMLEKASQINALIMSNNATINLADTMQVQHLSPIVHSIGGLTHHALHLKNMMLNSFCRAFEKEFNLKSVKIKWLKPKHGENAFFIAKIQTHNGNGFSTRACTLAGLTSAMSDRTLRDLMTMEFGHAYNGSAHNLLNVSSKLTSLSYILDDSFVPSNKLKGDSDQKNGIINSTSSH